MVLGQKHLVECHCVLPIFKNAPKEIYHKFPVYSKFDKTGKVIPKYVRCNNCEAVHFVSELCISEIKPGKEDIGSILTKEEISVSLSQRLVEILVTQDCTVADYEQVLDVIENEKYPLQIIVKREILEENHLVKILEIKSENKFKLFSEKINNMVLE